VSTRKDVLHEWPYKNGPEFMTPDVVWSSFVHADRLRRLWEIQLAHCAARIHNQREEIKRLHAENERLKTIADTDKASADHWRSEAERLRQLIAYQGMDDTANFPAILKR